MVTFFFQNYLFKIKLNSPAFSIYKGTNECYDPEIIKEQQNSIKTGANQQFSFYNSTKYQHDGYYQLKQKYF